MLANEPPFKSASADWRGLFGAKGSKPREALAKKRQPAEGKAVPTVDDQARSTKHAGELSKE